tara:strand:- start:16986 stop:17504 length:519 start_codon:yes stop_codon:yes gene_type:complete
MIPEEADIELLNKEHKRELFSCGVDALDIYLKQYARQNLKKHIAGTFVHALPDGTILGYYSLSAFAIDLHKAPAALLKGFPDYESVPATLLGRLAVDKQFKGKGVGGALLVDALSRSFSASKVVGSMAVVVDAKDEQAVAFYSHYGFSTFLGDESRLYLSMKQIEALVCAID